MNIPLVRELQLQRDRIAGAAGWRWVQHIPTSGEECCAVMYGYDFISTAAVRALAQQMTGYPLSVSYFNDVVATHQDMLDLFDKTIQCEESR